ncbi:hypothetical protein HQN90_14135 [Paenibacillus alba]|nr:hypothetical protein [Paenibacillus alba]
MKKSAWPQKPAEPAEKRPSHRGKKSALPQKPAEPAQKAVSPREKVRMAVKAS